MVMACVVYDTLYGNTEKIAKSLEAGLKRAEIQTACASVNGITVDVLAGFGLVCAGGVFGEPPVESVPNG